MFEISSQVTQLITHFWKIVESFVFQPSNESVSLGCRISSRCEKSGTFDFYLIVIWNSQTMKGRKVASHCERLLFRGFNDVFDFTSEKSSQVLGKISITNLSGC